MPKKRTIKPRNSQRPARGRRPPCRTAAQKHDRRAFAPARKKTGKRPGVAQQSRAVSLQRSGQNPLISPRSENDWEAWQTFNPGAVLLDGRIHILYRALGPDGVSRLGYAVSSDGLTIDERLPHPVYEHVTPEESHPDCRKQAYERWWAASANGSGGGFCGAEDPRPVCVDGSDTLFVTYTACGDGLRVGLASINVTDFLRHDWNWHPPVHLSPPGETHKNWVIFPEKIRGKYAILHSIKPAIQIAYVNRLDEDAFRSIASLYTGSSRKRGWDKWLRGAGPPPLKTDEGWLLLYHAMDDDWSKYKVGAMLLDLRDPTVILRRATAPVLEPEAPYEEEGYKPGVVYASGAVIKDGTLFVYYGGADSAVCVAFAPLAEFLAALKKEKRPAFRKAALRIPPNPTC